MIFLRYNDRHNKNALTLWDVADAGALNLRSRSGSLASRSYLSQRFSFSFLSTFSHSVVSETRRSINVKIKTSVVSESEKSTRYIRCVGFQEKNASVAADEMAVKRHSADTNFLEKKIGC